ERVARKVIEGEDVVFDEAEVDACLNRMAAFGPCDVVHKISGGRHPLGGARGWIEGGKEKRRDDSLATRGGGTETGVTPARDVHDVRREHRSNARRKPAGVVNGARCRGLA